MRRTIGLYVPTTFVVGAGWLSLDDSHTLGREALAVALLALAPALAAGLLRRTLAVAVATLLALGVAFGTPRAIGHVRDGALDFWDVSVPFDATKEPRMAGVVLMAMFAFSLAAALAIAARRPLAAALVTLAGTAWPATLVGQGAARGLAVLAVVLLLLAAGGTKRVPAWRGLAIAGPLVLVVALAGGTSSAVAKGELLDWKRWDPYDRPDTPVSVNFVWNANYDGIEFPDKETEVFTVDGVRRSLYWRATTLDTFDGLRWREELRFLGAADGLDAREDPLFPRRGLRPSTWLTADVTIHGLNERRLVAPTMPVRYDVEGTQDGDDPFLVLYHGGVGVVEEALRRDDTYGVRAYAPRPTPAQLARAPAPRAGPAIARYLELVPGVVVQPWGTPGRRLSLQQELTQLGPAGPLLPYAALLRVAERIGGTRDTPYAAAVSLETWLRSSGGYRYDEQPAVTADVPPLIGFVTRTKEGYCQHFAGAMALMLRMLGIPARVAAGFTSGSYEPTDGRPRWVVTDHDAHTWVEVWFDGWGWLPFDPTPGRGQLGGSYSTSSQTADVSAIQEAVRGDGAAVPGLDFEIGPASLAGGGGGGRARGPGIVSLLLLAVAAAVAGLALAKLIRRRWRYRGTGPRATAAACRAELVDFLADQRVSVSESATAAELAGEVRSVFGVDARPLAAALNRARYAPPGVADEAARHARRELANVRRLLSARLSRGERLRGLVSLRSLGLTG